MALQTRFKCYFSNGYFMKCFDWRRKDQVGVNRTSRLVSSGLHMRPHNTVGLSQIQLLQDINFLFGLANSIKSNQFENVCESDCLSWIGKYYIWQYSFILGMVCFGHGHELLSKVMSVSADPRTLKNLYSINCTALSILYSPHRMQFVIVNTDRGPFAQWTRKSNLS